MRRLLLTAALLACQGRDDRRSASVEGPPREPAAADAPAAPADAAPAVPRYKISFPAASKVTEASVPTTQGSMRQQVETAELDGTKYLVVSGSSPPGLPANNQAGGTDRILAMFGAVATRDVPVKAGDFAGREVQFTGKAFGILRTFVVASWTIQVGVVSRDHTVDEQRAKHFLDSLEIIR